MEQIKKLKWYLIGVAITVVILYFLAEAYSISPCDCKPILLNGPNLTLTDLVYIRDEYDEKKVAQDYNMTLKEFKDWRFCKEQFVSDYRAGYECEKNNSK